VPNLIVLTGLRRGVCHPLGEMTLIGRNPRADLQLPDPLISFHHAEVIEKQGRYELRDLGSRNGTYRNGIRVQARVVLEPEDVLYLGSTEMLFTARDESDREIWTRKRAPVPASRGEDDTAWGVLVADGGKKERFLDSSALEAPEVTMAFSHQHQAALERWVTKAADLDVLLERVASHFADALEGEAVLVVLEREEGREVALRARLDRSGFRRVSAESLDFEVRERFVERILRGEAAALLGRVGSAQVCCLGLPHPTGVAAAVYVHGVRDGLANEDLEPLIVLADLAGLHCRTHLLVSELKRRNVQLEEARLRLARWNEELQAAVDARTAELASSERSYRALFHESLDGNVTVDRRGRVQTVNRSAAEILDVEMERALGESIWSLFGPEVASHILASDPLDPVRDTHDFGATLAGMVERAVGEVVELPLETESGKRRFVELRVRPILEEEGEVEGVHAVLRDVTARQEAEQLTRLLSRIVENVPEAVVSLTPEGVVTSWNPGAEALYGYRAGEVMGQILPTVPDHRAVEFERILDAVADGRSLMARTERVGLEDRLVPVLATYAPVPDAAGEIVGVVELARDLTEQLQQEERLRRRERRASFGELATGLAHELGNPLASLRSGLEYLRGRPHDPEVAESLDLLQAEIERLQGLVQQSLDLARWRRPELRPVDPGEAIAHVGAVVRERAAELGVEIVVHLADGVRVLADADQLKQVLLNLVNNSFAAMPEGGRLELEVIRDEDGEMAGFSVRDTGRGIPLELQERIFEAFYSGRGGEGVGIGLALVKRIVELHQGRLELESAPEAGATIRVLFPLASAEEEVARA
jgi:PAS domain S-box-containing protein